MRISTLIVAAAAVASIAAPALAQPPGGGRPQMTPEQREAAFKAADKNNDGKLDKTEFAATLPEQFQDRADQVFGFRDADGDGFISHDEYMAPPRRPG